MIGSSLPSLDISQFANGRADARAAEDARSAHRHDAESSDDKPGRAKLPAALSEAGSFFGVAKSAVSQTLVNFAKEVKAAFKDFGLGEGALNDLVKSLIQPVMDAVNSGADFTAQIFVAGMKQVTAVGASSAVKSVDMVFKGIEIEFNHSTGELSVEQTSFSLQQTTAVSYDGAAPQFVNGTDGSLSSIADMFEEFNEYIKDVTQKLLDGAGANANADTALAQPTDSAVLQANENAASEKKAGAVNDNKTDASEEAVEATDADDEAASKNSLQISIDRIERFSNARMQQVTRIRFDLVMPITFQPAGQIAPIDATDSGSSSDGITVTA